MRGKSGKEDSKATSNLRVLIERRCLAPLTLNDNDGDDDAILGGRLPYHKLPQNRLKLSILKLDGSLFDVHIVRNATVGELKQAVEEVFTSSPKEGQGKISWSHVWGHFCLCYEGQKLINDKTCMRNLGIKDGDQLQFVRHMSINYSPSKHRYKNKNIASKWLLAVSNAHEEKEQSTSEDDDVNEKDENSNYYHYEDQEDIPMPEFKLAHFLKGWLSISRLWGVSRKGSEVPRPSRFAVNYLGGRSTMIQL